MSGPIHSALPPDAIRDPRMTGCDLDVLNDLGRFADIRTGWCYRAQKQIAAEIGKTRRTIQRSLDRLEELGYIEREARNVPGVGQKSNLYRVLFEPAGRRGQLDLFDADGASSAVTAAPKRAVKKASPPASLPVNDAPPRHAHGVNDAGGASCAGGKRRTIERDLNDTAADATRSRWRAANDDQAHPPTEAIAPPPPHRIVTAADRRTDHDLYHALMDVVGDRVNSAHPMIFAVPEPRAWLRDGCDLEFDVLPVVAALAARNKGRPIVSWAYFTGAVLEARDRRLAASLPNVGSPPSPDRPAGRSFTPKHTGDAHGRPHRNAAAARHESHLGLAEELARYTGRLPRDVD